MFFFCSDMADGSTLIDTASPSPAQDMRAVRSRMLLRMAEIVLDVAEMVREEVKEVRAEAVAAREAGEPVAEAVAPRLRLAPVDVGLTLSRLSRAMRLTLALEKRFDEEAVVFAEKEKAKADAAAEDAARAAGREQQFLDGMRENKHEAIAIAKAMAVEQARERGEAETDHEALFAELNERLEDDSDLEALSDYSMVDLVCLLCAKLGVPFDPATVGHSDQTLRKEWLDDLPDPPLKPPDHPGWAS
jgi:hypothetical protein